MKPSASNIPGKLRRLYAQLRDPKSVREKSHRLSASTTGDEDWDVDQPQIRMSRAFAVMLILHLVAVGGLFAFHVFGKDDQNAEQQATRKAHASATAVPASAAPRAEVVGDISPAGSAAAPVSPLPSAAHPPRAEVVPEDSLVDANGTEHRAHKVLDGESKLLIAALYGVSVKELQEANPDSTFQMGDSLTIPPHQRVIGATADGGNDPNPPMAVIAATSTDGPGHQEFVMKPGMEEIYQRDETAAEEKPAPAVRATPVTAKPSPRATSKSAPRAVAVDEEEHDRPAKPVKTPPVKTKPVLTAAGSRTHVVARGDTVYNVSRRYGLTPAEVMKVNNISDPSKLQLGQVLKISVRR